MGFRGTCAIVLVTIERVRGGGSSRFQWSSSRVNGTYYGASLMLIKPCDVCSKREIDKGLILVDLPFFSYIKTH